MSGTSRPISRRHFTLSGLGLAAGAGTGLLGLSSAARAATFPDHPITFICPWAAGGTADMTMRALCDAAQKVLGQTIVFENRPGASGMLGLRQMAGAKPDGYTIGQVPISVARFSQLGTVQIDPLKDLDYIARTSGQTFGIAVQADAKWKTLAELVADAKARPEQVTYATAGLGGATHVGMEEFAIAAGVKFNAIPYKGGSEALQALLGNHVDVLADSSSWAPHVRSGKLRLLATWGEQRTQEFKDVPTLKEAGYNVVVDAPNGIGAPAGVPDEVMAKLRQAFRTAVGSETFQQACARIDAPLMYLDAPEYRGYVQQTIAREKVLIDKLKLKELLAKS